jgi:hypothetical protein
MMTPPETLDLVRRLLAYESIAGKSSEPMESAGRRVYQKLRLSLGAIAGVAAFQSLASRALVLARTEAPSLGTAQVGADGSLQRSWESEPQIDIDKYRAGEGEIILLGHLLGLLLIFLGEPLTLSLLRDAWPGAPFDDRNSGIGRNA